VLIKEIYSGEKLLKRRQSVNKVPLFKQPSNSAPNRKEMKIESQYDSINCHTANSWQWGLVKFEFLNFRKETLPENGQFRDYAKGSSNNRSCVLSISILDKKILLTGDIEKKAERLLVESNVSPHDVIVAPHHGSLTSSGEKLVETVNAKVAIFSTGYANQWSFPKNEVLERYQNNGASIWITHKQGAINVIYDNDQLVIFGERESFQHFWNHQ
ncbi:MAG: ComEC/Rec2 family competence protein, partial [Kangiellaceae bacterium]